MMNRCHVRDDWHQGFKPHEPQDLMGAILRLNVKRGNGFTPVNVCKNCGCVYWQEECVAKPTPKNEEPLTLDRESLRLGKYTQGYENLTSTQLEGLLWLLGEWSCRVHEDGTFGANKARAQAAFDALRVFHRKPLTLEEVKALMRKARGV
jgi:hypothetical protein